MNLEPVRVLVYKNSGIYDDFTLLEAGVTLDARRLNSRECSEKKTDEFVRLKLNRRGLNAHLVSAYVYNVRVSPVYRKAALRALLQFSRPGDNRFLAIYIKLRTPRFQYLDYKWNDRVLHMASERRELDHAMSWLSTLGGGFSALGETFEHCAEMAGRISVRQLELALRLGDPLLIARCKLWAALSLIQRGSLDVARGIVKEIFSLAVAERDLRLQNMCKGIWAKLRYCYAVKRLEKTF